MQNLTIYDKNSGVYRLKDGASKTDCLNRLGMLEHIAEEKYKAETRETLKEMLSSILNKESASDISGLLLKTVLENLGDYGIEKPKESALKLILTPIIKEAVDIWLENSHIDKGQMIIKHEELYSMTGILLSKCDKGFIDITEETEPVEYIPGKSVIKIINLTTLDKNEKYHWHLWNEEYEKYEEILGFRGSKEYSFIIPENIQSFSLTVKGGVSSKSGWDRYIILHKEN